jgi:FkbM family methyltransferase
MLKKNIAKLLAVFAPSLLILIRSYKETIALSKAPILIGKGFNFTGNAAMMTGNFEPGETAIFEKLINQIDMVVNVGANVGYYCCLALHANKRVIAFEPMPKNVQALLANIRANNWGSRIEIFPMALGDKTGVLEIFGEGTGASLIKGWAGVDAGKVTLIPASTLDVVLGNRLEGSKCLLMVDIEGAEYQFLEGAKNFLNMSPKPICFMEISIQAQQPKGIYINPTLLQTFDVFWSRGYKAYTTHNSNRLVTREEVEAIVNGGPDTLYGDTFLFLDEEIHKNLI